MTDRTVTVRLKADISDFVTDIGVKAVAAVNKLERSASKVKTSVGTVGNDTGLDKLGTKADAAGAKVEKLGTKAEASGKKISSAAAAAGREMDKLGDSIDKVDKATASNSKATQAAAKNADSHANAVGRLRVAQLRLAEVQKKSNANPAALAGAEESVKAAERAVKKFEKAGEDSGRSFGAGFKKWLTGRGGKDLNDAGKKGGEAASSGLIGVFKTPVIGPIIIAALAVAVATAMPAVGALAAGGLVSAFGAGLAGLGIVFAAKSVAVKNSWLRTLASMAADMKVLSKPFEATLLEMSGVARRTFAAFKPALLDAFKLLAPTLSTFGDQIGRAFERLAPAVRPLSEAFAEVLSALGPAAQEAVARISVGLQELAASVQANPTALADLVRGIGEVFQLLSEGLVVLNNINGMFERLTGGISLVDVAMKGLQFSITATLSPFIVLEKAMNALGLKAKDMNQEVSISADTAKLWTQGLTPAAAAAVAAGNASAGAAPKIESLAQKFDRQTAATQRSIDALNRRSNLLLSLSGAEIDYQQAVDDATAAVKANGRTHDLNTQKGRDNQRALDQVAASAIAQRDAMLKANDGNVKAASAAEVGRAAYVKLAVQMGYNKAEAQAMAAQFIKIPNVTRTAKLNANITDLESKLATAKAKLKDPKLTATQRAKLEADIRNIMAGIAAAKAALASVPPSKTVNITVNTYRNMLETVTHKDVGVRAPGQANGGYYPGGVPAYANGKLPDQAMVAPGKGRGLVQWAEQETGGEAFIPLAPSKRDRSEKILGQVANKFGLGLVKSFADGGFNLPGGRLVDIAFLLRQLGVPFNPTAGVNYTSTLAAANRANRATVPARDAALRADRAEQAAKAQVAAIQRAITLQQRHVTELRRAGASDKTIAREQRETIALQDKLYAAKQRVTAATKASNAADAVYKIRADAAAKATQAHRDAIEKLIEQQKAAVEMADQIAQGLTGGANIGDLFQQSLTGKGLLADLQGKGTELGKFAQQVAALRKAGLSEVLIQQIVGKGAAQGGSAAQAILDGGLALINSLNKAQALLQQQADLIGAGSAAAKYGTKVAGARAGGGSVGAGMTYRVNEKGEEFFTAPINGQIVPAGQDPRRYIQAFAGGGSSGSRVVREIHNHQNNYFTGVSMAEADLIAQRANAKADLMNRGY